MEQPLRVTRRWTLSFRLKSKEYDEVYMEYTPCTGPQLSYATYVWKCATQESIFAYIEADITLIPESVWAWRLA